MLGSRFVLTPAGGRGTVVLVSVGGITRANKTRCLLLLLWGLVLANASCNWLNKPINISPGFKWWLFSHYGASKICPELLRQGIPLSIRDGAPAMGRFFPAQCRVSLRDESHTATVVLAGTGYGFSPMAGRLGFAVRTAIQFRPELRMYGDDTYVWGIFNRMVQGPHFQLTFVENRLAGAAAGPFGAFTNMMGDQLVRSKLTQGFTVLHTDRGNSFALGIIRPPRKPRTPFLVRDGDMYTYANETIELHAQQRDFLGPFQVLDRDQRLVARYRLRGAAVDVLVVSKPTGDRWRDAYQRGLPLGPPPGRVLAGCPVQPGRDMRIPYRLPVGSYYFVIDHTSYAGRVNPVTGPFGRLGGSAAVLSYLIQLRD